MPDSAPFRSTSCRCESALRPEERSARYHHNGAVIWLTGLPGSGKSTLARALERRLFSRGGSPILLDGDTLRAGLNGDLGFSPQDRSENIRRLAEVATHLARNGHVAIVAAVSPSICGSRRRAPHRRHRVPRDPCRDPGRSLREPRPQGPLRQGARRHAARRSPGSAMTTSRRRECELRIDTSARIGYGCDRRDRADAGRDRYSVRRTGRSGGQYLRQFRANAVPPLRVKKTRPNRPFPVFLGPSHRPGFRAKRAANAALFGAFFAAFVLKSSL